ncbi:MAG: hypothetical protein HOP15_17610 [Planctomycetes bacterium]|nr:hypothetical protein [Planctomycetota bacterium]
MNEFAERLIADLRTFSGHLLDPTGAPERSPSLRILEGGTESVLLGAVRALAELVPRLLDELEDLEDPRQTVQHRCWTATRAKLSRSPSDWQISAGRALPQRWMRMQASPEPDLRALGWLLHLEHTLSDELLSVSQRTQRYIDEARAARRGTSGWAAQDQEGLDALARRANSARLSLESARRSIVRRGGGTARRSRRAPSPFPRGRSWWRLRQLAGSIEDKQRTLAERIAALLHVAPELADEAVLYQRWCGMRIIEGLGALGWKAEGDYIGALYLAGHVSFHKDGTRIDLWIENRVTREAHASGFLCVRGADATPDYLIVTPGAGGLDAFVLDATKSTDEEVVGEKRRYLDLLQGVAPAMIAGVVSGPRRPLRSWAGAPFDLGHCRLTTQSGSSGVIPMNPLVWNPAPLCSWLSDIERHARAWT